MLASIPARTLNPIRSRRGIPRFSLFGKCSKGENLFLRHQLNIALRQAPRFEASAMPTKDGLRLNQLGHGEQARPYPRDPILALYAGYSNQARTHLAL
jgi:hypothetical protein